MGVYPHTERGALRLLEDSARLAVRAGAGRLIVKTAAEAHRIPTVDENVRALETAAAAAALEEAPGPDDGADSEVYLEARALVEAVLDLHPDLARALPDAFARGLLDVPFCLHPDNPGRSLGFIDPAGRLRWARTGAMPLRPDAAADTAPLTADGLLTALWHVAGSYDGRRAPAGEPPDGPAPGGGHDHSSATPLTV